MTKEKVQQSIKSLEAEFEADVIIIFTIGERANVCFNEEHTTRIDAEKNIIEIAKIMHDNN